MSNPVDDYLNSSASKTTAVDAFRKSASEKKASFWKGVGQSVIAGGAIIGAEALYDAAKSTYHASRKKKHFQGMLGSNPDLRVEQRNNPDRFNQQYQSLHKLSPEFAADPLVAGAYMRQMSDNPMNAGGVLINAAQDVRSVRQTPGMGPMRAMEAGRKWAPEILRGEEPFSRRGGGE